MSLHTQKPGDSFSDREVANNYRYRPPYPTALFAKLASIAQANDTVLDLGCGPGKVALGLKQRFSRVVGVDPSAAMLSIARGLDDTNQIEWIEGDAETTQYGETKFNLIVAGASIHWMDHPSLFSHLKHHVTPRHVFAVLDGDGADNPPWEADWQAFLGKWVPLLTGEAFSPSAPDSPYRLRQVEHLKYLTNVSEVWTTTQSHTQSVTDFILCQHSRETFAPYKMGGHLAAFDQELADLLSPFADNGMLQFETETRLRWGSIRS